MYHLLKVLNYFQVAKKDYFLIISNNYIQWRHSRGQPVDGLGCITARDWCFRFCQRERLVFYFMQFKMELGKTFSLSGTPANAFKRRSIRAATEKYISQMVWRHYSLFWLCHSTWLLYFSSMLKIETFSPIFPLTDSIIEASYWLFLWNFKKESINRFLWHSLYFLKFQINPSPCYGMWLFHLHNMAKKQLFFFNFSVGGLSGWGILSVIPLELQEMQHQAFPMIRPKKRSALAIFFQRKKTCIIAVLCKIPTLSYDRALWKGFAEERHFIRPCPCHILLWNAP